MLRDFTALPSDERVLETLQAALYRTDEPLTPEKKREYISLAAADLVAMLPSREYLIELEKAYNRVRASVVLLWGDLDFGIRMAFREMVIHIRRNLGLYELLSDDDRQALLKAMLALDSSSVERYEISRQVHFLIADDMSPLIQADAEVSSSITAEEVWNKVKHLDPKMEEALRKPLDPSKYVTRDLRKTPRRSA
jgi:hypothetical protein